MHEFKSDGAFLSAHEDLSLRFHSNAIRGQEVGGAGKIIARTVKDDQVQSR